MTGTIIFKLGEPKVVEFEGVFEDQHRFINSDGTIMAAQDYPKDRFHTEPYLLIFDKNAGKRLGKTAVVSEETVTGESLRLPYVESVTHSVNKEQE